MFSIEMMGFLPSEHKVPAISPRKDYLNFAYRTGDTESGNMPRLISAPELWPQHLMYLQVAQSEADALRMELAEVQTSEASLRSTLNDTEGQV